MSRGQHAQGRHGTDSGKRRCGHCNAHVSLAFARVFGDNQNDVYACPACATMRELRNGAGRRA